MEIIDEKQLDGKPETPGREARRFLDALGFGDLSGLELRLIGPKRARSLWPKVGEKLWPEVKKANERAENIYFGICPRRDRKGGKANIVEARALWVDLDGHDYDFNPDKGKELAREALENRLPPELQPSIVVDSGNGWHAYWALPEPYVFSGPEDIDRFEAHLRGLARHLGGDESCADVARVLRLPGTQNVKDPKVPKPCTIVSLDVERTFELDNIAELAPPVERSESQPPPDEDDGETIPRGQRNKRLTTLAGAMRRRGAGLKAITEALLGENDERCSPPLSEDEVRRIAKSVMRYGPEAPRQEDAKRSDSVPTFKLWTVNEIVTRPPDEELIEGWLVRGRTHFSYSPPGEYKSVLAMDWGLHIAAGMDWFGAKVEKPESVVFVAAEGQGGLRARLLAWHFHRDKGTDDTRLFRIVDVPVDLLSPPAIAGFIESVGGATTEGNPPWWPPPALIVFDTVSANASGADENSQADMSKLVHAVKTFQAAWGSAILLVHHTNKSGAWMRGSSVLLGAADRIFRLRKERDVTADEDGAATLMTEKSKDTEKNRDLVLSLQKVQLPEGLESSVVVVGAEWSHGTKSKTFEAIDLVSVLSTHFDTVRGASDTEWKECARAAGCRRSTYYRYRKWVLERGYVREIETAGKRIRYAVSDKGVGWLREG